MKLFVFKKPVQPPEFRAAVRRRILGQVDESTLVVTDGESTPADEPADRGQPMESLTIAPIPTELPTAEPVPSPSARRRFPRPRPLSALWFLLGAGRWTRSTAAALARGVPSIRGQQRSAQAPRRPPVIVRAGAAGCLLVLSVGALQAAWSQPELLPRAGQLVTGELEQMGILALAQDALSETHEAVNLLLQEVESATRFLRSGSRAPEPALAGLAYRAAFGHRMDEDLPAHQADVEAWLRTWQAAYRAGEPWAHALAADVVEARARR
jgi:hypothetical protein